MTTIDVSCDEVAPDGAYRGEWTCDVAVTDGGGRADFEVSVRSDWLRRIAPTPEFNDVQRLLKETFAFLLEREPKESILSRFDVSLVESYFPEYPSQLRTRLSRR